MTDDDSKIELNRRRVLGGIVTVGAAAAAAGAGTTAYFSTEQSEGNTITAGGMSLDEISQPFSIDSIVPGETSKEVKITGTYNGDVESAEFDVGITQGNDNFASALLVETADLTIASGTVNDNPSGTYLSDLEGAYTGNSIQNGSTFTLTLQFTFENTNSDQSSLQNESVDVTTKFRARQSNGDALTV